MATSSELLIASLLNPDHHPNDASLTNDDGDIPVDTLTSTLQKLQRRKGTRQQQLQDLVKSQLDAFLAIYKHAKDIQEVLSATSVDCIEATALALDPEKSVLTLTKNAISQYQGLCSKKEANEETLKALQELLKMIENMDHAQDVAKSGRILDATHIYKDIDQQLTTATLPWCSESIRSILQQRLSLSRDTLIEIGQELFWTAVQFDENNGIMTVQQRVATASTSGNTVSIKDILESWILLEALPAQVSSIKKSIFRHIITPFFSQCHQCHVNIENDSNDRNKAILRLLYQQQLQGKEERVEKLATADGVELIENVSKILQFISRQLLDGYDTTSRVVQVFGNMFLADILNMLIEKGLIPLVPASYEELYKFERINEAAKTFEQQCRDLYGSTFDGGENHDGIDRRSLSAFVAGIDSYFADKRTAKIMLDGRQIMMRRLYDTEETNEPGGNGVGTRKITQTPKLLFILLSDTLAEAGKLDETHPVSAKKLRDAVPDLIDLYRAIMPSYHRSFLTASPANILIFENDCRWLAKSIATLPDKKASTTTQIAQKLQSSADKVQSLAELWRQVAVKKCVKQLNAILNDTHGFMSIAENRQIQEQCERAITRVIQTIHLYANECRPVVDDDAYTEIVASVIDSVLTRIIKDVESLSDIGAEDSHYIARSLNSLLQLIQVFDLPGRDATETIVVQLVPNWSKFWQLNRILEMNLRDIMEAYRSGELLAFTKSELTNLICALFADTEIRERSILDIKTTEPQQPQSQQRDMSPSAPAHTLSPVTPTLSHTSLSQKTSNPIPTSNSASSPAPEHEPKKARLAYSMEPQDMDEGAWGWDEADEEISGWDDQPIDAGEQEHQEEEVEANNGWGDLDEKLDL